MVPTEDGEGAGVWGDGGNGERKGGGSPGWIFQKGLGLQGAIQARVGRSAAGGAGARQPASIANKPHELLGEVVCGTPPATVVVVPGFPVQSARLKPEAVCGAENSVVAVAVAFSPAFELWY